MKVRRRQLSCLVATGLLIAAIAGERTSAGRLDSPGHEDGNRCLNEFGIDLNQLYGVTAQMQTGGCRQQTAGGAPGAAGRRPSKGPLTRGNWRREVTASPSLEE